jgi:hypothetical protein
MSKRMIVVVYKVDADGNRAPILEGPVTRLDATGESEFDGREEHVSFTVTSETERELVPFAEVEHRMVNTPKFPLTDSHDFSSVE